MIRKTLKCNLGFLLLGCACVLSASPAQAIMITVNSIAKTGDTPNYNNNNGANEGEWQSAVSTLSSGANSGPDAVSASVSAETRYASVLGTDVQALNFGGRTDNATSNYTVVFTVTPSLLVSTYSVTIDTRRLGALVVRNEGGAAATATLNGVTGTLSNAFTGTLNLPGVGTLNSNATAVTPFNQTASAFVTGPLSGVQVFTMQFSWTQQTSGANNVASGSDEGVVLMGLAGVAPDIGAADDYPGTSGRTNQAADGHFALMTATILTVPEPSSILLGSMGGFAIGIAMWRRRRR